MPRRAVASATPNRASSNVSFRDTPVLPPPDAAYTDNVAQLRRHWKWAAFSQFFYTFAQLLQMPDVSISDIEDDLARGTGLYIPRVMQRLLYTLTQDRKMTLETWQSGMRKQYLRRDPAANPLGVEPPAPSRKHSREPTTFSDAPNGHESVAQDADSVPQTPLPETPAQDSENPEQSVPQTPHDGEQLGDVKKEAGEIKKEDGATDEVSPQEEHDETKDWFDLPLLTKLDTLHTLAEWQFETPHRLRHFMKDDGEAGQWRIEPIGYDAKTNAYWLIGDDRLWIQRVPPKPPRPPRAANRKRKAPAKKAAKASTSRVVVESDPEPEPEPESDDEPSSKRRRTTRSGGRSSRAQAKESTPTSRRGTRRAKLQANKKLDAQAKELAEYQRQTALLASASPSRSSGRATRNTRGSASSHAANNASGSGRRGSAVVGTRASARLRGKDDEEEDEEWQQIPDEWLNDPTEEELPSRSNHRRTRGKTRAATANKGKGRARARVVVEDDEEGEEETEEDELKHLAEQAGLESDGESSVLTELSDEPEEKAQGLEDAEGDADEEQAETESTTAHAAEEATTAKTDSEPKVSRAKGRKQGPAESDPEQKKASEEPQISLPPGFVEWEALAVSLFEWEHVAEPFEKATHYLEKALYKVLSQTIVPDVTERLREAERKRKMEEALVHRKRSSRIAMREIEKEEARAAAIRKAEEDEKMARERRAEARAREKEQEREAREKAREQRRLEREERVKQEQLEKERENAEVDVVTMAPAPAPPVNGASSSSKRASHTPSGVRSPDWILDCEICHKNGRNLDDGTAMVCCNVCQRWQHIRCHDLADRQAGRPQRNWNQGQFYCQRCRPAHSRVVNGNIHQHRPVDRYVYAQPSPAQKAIAQHTIYQQPNDTRYAQYQGYENGTPYRQQPYISQPAAQSSYPRMQQHGQAGISFSHYQPEQGGFSRTQMSQMPPAQPWQSGYPAANGTPPRPSSSMQVPQYAQNGMYNGARVPSPYQYQSPNQQQPYNRTSQEPTTPITNGNWANVPADYFQQGVNASHSGQQPSASQLHAAESLASMYRAGGSGHPQQWPNGAGQSQPPQQSQSNGYPPPTVHLPPMSQSQYPPS